MGNQQKLDKRLADLNREVARLNKEKTAISKFEMNEILRMKAGKSVLTAFVHDILVVNKGKAGLKYYYDLILMEPTYPGSAVLHKVKGMSETQLIKNK